MLVFLVTIPLMSGVAQEPAQNNVNLALAPDVEMHNATLLLGSLTLDPPEVNDPRFASVTNLTVGLGQLVVCPRETDSGALIDQLTSTDGACSEAEYHDDPTFEFGPKTWMTAAGQYALHNVTPNGTQSLNGLHMFSPHTESGAIAWLHVGQEPTVTLRPDDGVLRFGATTSTSVIQVHSDNGTTWYNGTQHLHFYRASDDSNASVALRTPGLASTIGERAFALEPARTGMITRSVQPRALLDLQETLLGTDAREAVRNVTSLFAHTRLDELLDGSVIGRLNGTVDGQLFERNDNDTYLIRFESLQGTLRGDTLSATGRAELIVSADSVAVADRDTGTPPWWTALMLWIVAVLAILLGRTVTPDKGWTEALLRWLPLVHLVLWDRVFAQMIGTSAINRALGDVGTLSDTLRLLVFELLAAGSLYVAIWLPMTLIGRRVLPQRLRWAARVASFLIIVAYTLWRPQDLIALGLTFARL